MAKEFALTAEQLAIFKTAQTEFNQLQATAKSWVDLFNLKQKALNDLVGLYCSMSGLNKDYVKIDIDRGVAIEEVPASV